MKAMWAIVHSSFRGYRTIRGSLKSSSDLVSGEKLQSQMFAENANNIDDNEEYDPDAHESNFSTIGELHKMHEEEMSIQKERIKTRIIKRKYFESREPAMLTWGEKEQIRLLHAEDPKEWSVDKLSESFPASRETIIKILRSKWLAKSIKVIENHDAKVKNNWELLRAEKLVVEPQLHAHLLKFKHREIKAMDKETRMKFIKAKPVFPNPTSVMFSHIIQSYDNYELSNKNRNQVDKMCIESVEKLSKQDPSRILHNKNMTSDRCHQQVVTHDIFLKMHAEKVNENEITPMDRVIINKNKQRNAEAYKSKSLVLESKSIMGNFKVPEVAGEEKNEISLVESIKEDTLQKNNCQTINENSMETGIIARQKKSGVSLDNYPEFIKIPATSYKPGTVYKIQDRYYDHDGEFLYRVPGILS